MPAARKGARADPVTWARRRRRGWVVNSVACILQLQAVWRALSGAPAEGAHIDACDVALLALLCATVIRPCAAREWVISLLA